MVGVEQIVLHLRIWMAGRDLHAAHDIAEVRIGAQKISQPLLACAPFKRAVQGCDIARHGERLLALRALFLRALAQSRLELFFGHVPEAGLRVRVARNRSQAQKRSASR